MVPSEGTGQAGEEGPGRGLPGHAEDSEEGETPPGLVLSCCRCTQGGLAGHPAAESLARQVGRRGRNVGWGPLSWRQRLGRSWEVPFESVLDSWYPETVIKIRNENSCGLLRAEGTSLELWNLVQSKAQWWSCPRHPGGTMAVTEGVLQSR